MKRHKNNMAFFIPLVSVTVKIDIALATVTMTVKSLKRISHYINIDL